MQPVARLHYLNLLTDGAASMSDYYSTARPPQKLCTICKNSLPATVKYFYIYRERFTSSCKECILLKRKEYWRKNRSRLKIGKAEYRRSNIEQIKARDKKYYQKNIDKIRLQYKRYRMSNRERIKQVQKLWREKNREYCREQNAVWRAVHPGYSRQLYWRNPENGRAKTKTRKATKRNAPINNFTAKQWQDMKTAYGFRCVYCGKKTIALTQDHITPLAKGGAHTLYNIVPACISCNCRKQDGPIPCPIQPLLL